MNISKCNHESLKNVTLTDVYGERSRNLKIKNKITSTNRRNEYQKFKLTTSKKSIYL
jgi:hypothetical protein